MKRRTFAKVKWAVKAYQEWREVRMQDYVNSDPVIFEANLESVSGLTKVVLKYSLSRFIPEVTKLKDGSQYLGKMLYEMIIAIQKHLNEKGLGWKLIDDVEFKEVRVVLDNVMKQHAEANVGMVKKQACFMPFEVENELWQKGVLGEDNRDKLRSTVLFLVGLNCGLRAGDEHYELRRDGPTKLSQFSFQRNTKGE